MTDRIRNHKSKSNVKKRVEIGFGGGRRRAMQAWFCYQQLMAAERTEFGRMQFDTLRVKLLKVGGRVRESVRRIRFFLSESYPYKAYWRLFLISPFCQRFVLRC